MKYQAKDSRKSGTINASEDPLVYSREVLWDDRSVTTQCNLERPNLLFEDGRPTHLFLAAGNGDAPYQFTHTWNMVIPIKND